MTNDRQIRLTLPPREDLLPLVDGVVRKAVDLLGFPAAMEDMLVGAALEACEELLRAGRLVGLDEPFDLLLDFGQRMAEVSLVYNGKIPLNPHVAEPYEVPTIDSDLAEIDVDTLWLHLIKHHMDRVFFEIHGPLHQLRMLKYRREEGEERRLWFLGLSPALKPGLHVEYAGDGGQAKTVLLQDFQSGRVFRFGPVEALAVSQMDGKTTLYDIYLGLVEQLGPVSPHRLGVLFEALEAAGMLAAAEARKATPSSRSWLQKLANPIFSIPRADEVVGAIFKATRPLVSPWGVAVCLAIGLAGLAALAFSPAMFGGEQWARLERLILRHPASLAVVYALQALMIACHELAHGVACKRFGGKTPRLGVTIYLASVIFFCDTTSAWSFAKKSHRLMVSLAGPLVSFAFLGGSLLATGHLHGSQSFWEPVFVLNSLLCFFGLVMNFNPFIRMDAYFMLMDLTGVNNLREKSFRFLAGKILGPFIPSLRIKSPPGRRERVIFWLYGLIGAVVTAVLFILPFAGMVWLLLAGDADQGRVLLGLAILALALLSLGNKAVATLRLMRHREYKIK